MQAVVCGRSWNRGTMATLLPILAGVSPAKLLLGRSSNASAASARASDRLSRSLDRKASAPAANGAGRRSGHERGRGKSRFDKGEHTAAAYAPIVEGSRGSLTLNQLRRFQMPIPRTREAYKRLDHAGRRRRSDGAPTSCEK